MNKQDLIIKAEHFIEDSADNYISKQKALSLSVEGMKIFDKPIFSFGSADDELFTSFKQSSVIGAHFLSPKEWLPEAKTVISFFLPFTETVKKGNKKDVKWPAEEWLHGRYEGQMLLEKLCEYLISVLSDAGYKCIVPSLDERFWTNDGDEKYDIHFSSNWSERHAAFACGLGTFGLSAGLITRKGIAGRFGSIITDLFLPPDTREYNGVYEYCNMCGVCVKRCPVNAISVENGKDHFPCYLFIEETRKKFIPRYGCGKCQVGVPCESRVPKSLVTGRAKE